MSISAAALSDTGMRVIDDRFVSEARVGSSAATTTIEASRSRPYLDIEVLSNPAVDPLPILDGESGELETEAGAFVRRYRHLREPFQDTPPDIVLCRGVPAVDNQLLARAAEVSEHRITLAAQPGDGSESGGAELAALYRVFLRREKGEPPDRTLAAPFAHVLLLGWHTGLRTDGPSEGAPRSAELLRALTESDPVRNAPLYVLVAVADRADPFPLLAECERLRVSLVLAESERGTDLVSVSRSAQDLGQGPASISLARCPDFRAGTPTSGMARVRLDLWRGEAEIAVRRDLGGDLAARPVQVGSPLLSASRVASSERRLRSRVDRLLVAAAGDSAAEAELKEFEDSIESRWKEHGYVTLCNPSGRVPLSVTRHTRYELLVLLRRQGSGYDVMLSNHSPLRPSPLSDWNTLLLPAFKDVRSLLEHLRDDVLRQAQERAEDFEKLAHARAFEGAVERILSDEADGNGDELWADEVRAVADKKVRKISPTTGAVTEFDYRLITLLPLVDRATARDDEEEPDPLQRRQRDDRRRIVEWLHSLDTVSRGGAGGGLPLEAFGPKGCGLRWDPASGLLPDPNAEERRLLHRAPPGALWFPLTRAGEEPLWKTCPAIISRNLDVMSWLEEQLEKGRDEEGHPPAELMLGERSQSSSYELERPFFPFEGRRHPPNPNVPGTSTVDALKCVRFARRSDLREKKAYAGATFERVFLHRKELEVAVGTRLVIAVYPAGESRSWSPETGDREPLGVLRPVQRYVLKSGIERAREVNRHVLDELVRQGDPWGFARVRKGGAPQAVSITPPIIEQVSAEDREGCADDLEEFLVCDGNHRIVQRVWEEGEPMPAVAVIGELAYPYYARPFGRFEWEATVDNELAVTPDLASKYLARKVDFKYEDRPTEMEDVPRSELYRRYFRDLETGFGYVGGQGGRYY